VSSDPDDFLPPLNLRLLYANQYYNKQLEKNWFIMTNPRKKSSLVLVKYSSYFISYERRCCIGNL